MKKQDTFKVINVTRLNNSVNGCPRYELELETLNGNGFMAKTTSDSPAGYQISNQREITCNYHVTRNGNILIDYLVD